MRVGTVEHFPARRSRRRRARVGVFCRVDVIHRSGTSESGGRSSRSHSGLLRLRVPLEDGALRTDSTQHCRAFLCVSLNFEDTSIENVDMLHVIYLRGRAWSNLDRGQFLALYLVGRTNFLVSSV